MKWHFRKRREFGQAINAVREAKLSVRLTMAERLHRHLAILDRSRALPEELPPVPKDELGITTLVGCASKLVNNQQWWSTAPEYFPLPEEDLTGMLKVLDEIETQHPRTEQHKQDLSQKGMSKQVARIKLLTMISHIDKLSVGK